MMSFESTLVGAEELNETKKKKVAVQEKVKLPDVWRLPVAQATLASASKTQLNVQLGFLLHRTVISKSPKRWASSAPLSVNPAGTTNLNLFRIFPFQ